MVEEGSGASSPQSGFLQRPAHSVLSNLRVVTGSAPRVLLPDLPNQDTPVVGIGVSGRDADVPDAGRYQLLGEIARGGVGVILKGRDTDLGRDVAMKVLREEHGENDQVLRRFVEEAQIDAQLQHPGVVPVYELGLLEGRRPFFTMKLVKGKTLGALLQARRDPLEDRLRFLRIFEKVAQTVAYAHTRRVIHRDLKPANVMVGAFGEVLVVDWGFAKVLGREEASVAPEVETVRSGREGSASQVGSVLGTPTYMPPEQARGRVAEIDERSDVFALGAILCEILTGRPPYPADPREALRAAMKADLDETYAALSASDSDRELATLVRRCLSEGQSARPADAREVAGEVTAYLTSVEERARQAEIQQAEAEARATGDRTARRLTLGLAAAVILALLVGGAAYGLRERDRRARLDATAEAVNEALRDARRAWGAAQTATIGEVAPWETARRAAVAAGARLRAGPASDALKAEVAALTGQVEEEATAALRAAAKWEKDEAMKQRLEELRIRRARDPMAANWGDGSAEAFREYGIDLEGLPVEEAALRIQASAIARELVAGVDAWAFLEGGYTNAPVFVRGRRMLDIALAADEDPIRRRLRRAVLDRDLDTLRELAASMDDALFETNAANMLGHFLGLYGDREESIEFLGQVIAGRPDRNVAHVQLAHLLITSNPPRLDDGIGHARAALAVNPRGNVALFWLAWAHRRRGELDVALRTFEESLAAYPDDFNPYRWIVIVLQEQGELDRTIDEWRRAADAEPKNLGYQVRLGMALTKAGRTQDAVKVFDAAIELDPDRAFLHHERGSALVNQYALRDAAKAYEEAARLAPYWVNPRKELAHLLGTHLHQMDAAIPAWEEVLTWEGTVFQGDSWHGLGLVHLFRGDFDEAQRCFDQAQHLFPVWHLPHSSEGHLNVDRAEWRKAEECYANALGLQPGLLFEKHRLGWVLARQQRWEEALEHLRPVRERYAAGQSQGVDVVRNLRAVDSAIRACEMALDPPAEPTDLTPGERVDLATARFYEEAFVDAVALYEEACAEDPSVARAGEGGMARAAALASADPTLSDDDRAALSGRAVVWMRAALEAEVERLWDAGPLAHVRLRSTLLRWKRQAELAPIRDAGHVDALTPEAGGACQELWAEIDETFQRSRETTR